MPRYRIAWLPRVGGLRRRHDVVARDLEHAISIGRYLWPSVRPCRTTMQIWLGNRQLFYGELVCRGRIMKRGWRVGKPKGRL